MRPLLSVMSYGGVDPGTCDAVLRDIPTSTLSWAVAWEGGDADVCRQRNRSATQFLKTHADVLVQVDHDVSWCPGDLDHLATTCFAHSEKSQKGAIVGGLVAKRTWGEGYGGFLDPKRSFEFPSDEVVTVNKGEYIGGAFTAISRKALLTIAATLPMVGQGFYPFYQLGAIPHPDVQGQFMWLSEDWFFCAMAQEMGVETYATLRPITMHRGHVGFSVIEGNAGRTKVRVHGTVAERPSVTHCAKPKEGTGKDKHEGTTTRSGAVAA